jgi:hypothetical protein
MVTNQFTTKIGQISLLENGIIRVKGNSDVHISLEDMYENDSVFAELLKGKSAPFLTIFGENATIDPEAELYFANKERSSIKVAEALVTWQTHHKLIGLTHLTNLKPDYPIMQFKDESEAMRWLEKFLLI